MEDTIYNLISRIKDRGAGDQTVNGEKYSHAAKSNEWLVKIRSDQGGGVLTKSNAETYGSDHTLLFDFIFNISRRTNSNIVESRRNDSARTQFSNPLIKIPNDTWTPSLEYILVNGILVEDISLKRMANTGKVNTLVHQIDFINCILQDIVMDDDYVWLEFRAERYNNSIKGIGQDGQPEGFNSFSYNISTAQTTLGADPSGEGEATVNGVGDADVGSGGSGGVAEAGDAGEAGASDAEPLSA